MTEGWLKGLTYLGEYGNVCRVGRLLTYTAKGFGVLLRKGMT